MGQTALETKSLCFNMGKRRHPLFGSGRDFFIQISSPTYAANRTESISANRMLISPPWVKQHSKPNPYALTWENDVIHYSVPVATFSSRFRVQRMPLIEMSRLAQTGCKSAYQGLNDTRNQIPMILTWENDFIHYSVPVATFFIQISSPTYAANRTESIGANRM